MREGGGAGVCQGRAGGRIEAGSIETAPGVLVW